MPSVNPYRIGVVGAGTMGAGIALVAAQAGYETPLYDVSQEFIDRGMDQINKFLQGSLERGKITAEEKERVLSKLTATLELEDLKGSALVVEAAPENLDLKRDIFQKLDSLCEPETLLATNTSSLSVTAIGGKTRTPARVLGTHFFNPPPLMGLVEVIQGEQTTADSVQKTAEIVRPSGKDAHLLQGHPRVRGQSRRTAFYNEALRILEEGEVTVETVDRIMKGAGFRMGPFELMDLIGMDVNFTATGIPLPGLLRRSPTAAQPHSTADVPGGPPWQEDRKGLLRLSLEIAWPSSGRTAWRKSLRHSAVKRATTPSSMPTPARSPLRSRSPWTRRPEMKRRRVKSSARWTAGFRTAPCSSLHASDSA